MPDFSYAIQMGRFLGLGWLAEQCREGKCPSDYFVERFLVLHAEIDKEFSAHQIAKFEPTLPLEVRKPKEFNQSEESAWAALGFKGPQ